MGSMRTQPLLSIDSRSLVLFRICVCLWTFRDLYSRIWDLEAFHTEDGVLQPHMTPHKAFIHQILFYRGSSHFQVALFIVHFIVTCNLLIGYKTTLSSFIHYLFTISIMERQYYILDGGDRVFRHLAFWLIFLPSWHGNNTSIDAVHIQNKRKRCLTMLIAKESKKKKSKTNEGNESKIKPTGNTFYSMVRSYATAAILVQCMIIYPFILLHRMGGYQQTWYWHKCSAVYNSMAAYTMSNDLGMYIASFPMINFLMCRITLIFEAILPILILIVPYDVIKLLIIAVLMGMQIGFNVFIRIENFGYSMATSMVVFLPSLFWDKIETMISNISILNNIKMKMRDLLMTAARRFQIYERLSEKLANGGKIKEIKDVQSSLLWDIPFVSDAEKANIRMIGSSKDIMLLQPRPTILNKILSIFFFAYLIMNNFGDVQLRLFEKPDGGNIGEFLRLDQQWVMYGPDVDESVSFNLLIGEVEFEYMDGTKGKQKIVLNDLLTSNWNKVTVFEGEDKYKRPYNPTYLNPSMRWERLLVKTGRESDMRDSVLAWFCKHGKGLELTLKYQNHNNKYDDGVPVKEEYVKVERMTSAEWCTASGDIVQMWKQDTTKPMPQYENESINCAKPMVCPKEL